MSRDLSVYGIGISLVSVCLRYVVTVMPKPIAWAGIFAGTALIFTDFFVPMIKPTPTAGVIFVIGCFCIGLSIYLSLQSGPTPTASQPAPANAMGNVGNNSGIISQGQTGDNEVHPK